MIQVENVVKTFDGFRALDGLTMNVKKGSVYGLVGPNGAGKSTIIRHLTGIYRQDSGKVLIDGQSVYENVAIKSKFAYIPDDIFYFTTDNSLDLMKLYKGIYKNFDEDLFKRLGECFPDINLKKNVRALSKGMQKQVAFMLSIASRPEILILDEPVDGLDPVMRRQIWSIVMSDVAEHEATVLVSSHNLRELEDVCDHVGIMNHGKILLEKSLDDLQSDITKLQIAFEDKPGNYESELDILKETSSGRVHTLIVRGDSDTVTAKMKQFNPIFMDVLPLTLEEIFIYELGGEEYAVKDIIL